jgi:hypothetical protein
MTATVGRRTLRWSMFWAVISYLITTLGTALTNYLTSLDVSPLQGSLISTAVGLIIVFTGVLIDRAKDGGTGLVQVLPPSPYQQPSAYPYQQPTSYPPHQPGYAPTARRGRTSVVAAVVVILLLCGVGGLGVTFAAQWAASRAVAFFKDQSTPPWEKKTQDAGVERIADTASQTKGPLTVTVTSVRVNSEVTMLSVTAANTGNETLFLPIFTSAQLAAEGSDTLQADPAASKWPIQVPAGGQISGTIVFDGTVGSDVTTATLTFAQVMGSLDGPRSISVEIPLN